MTDEFDYKRQLLKQEMDTSQNGIKTYNEAQFKVKSFAIPLLAGFLTFAMDENRPAFLLSGVVIVILFWFQDAYFQSIQRVYMDRAREIEAIFLSAEFSQAFASRSLGAFTIAVQGKQKHVPFLALERGCIDWEDNRIGKIVARVFSFQNCLLYGPLLLLVLGLWIAEVITRR
jgi:hypothetical protein